MISEYTSYNEVRSVLGVERDELKDETIDERVYFTGLMEELHDIHPRLDETYKLASASPTQTPSQIRLINLVGSFSTYAVARQFTSSLPMFAPRSISDGKATLTRFPSPYEQTIANIESKFNHNRGRLKDIIDDMLVIPGRVEPRIVFAAVGPAYDPVTGTGG